MINRVAEIITEYFFRFEFICPHINRLSIVKAIMESMNQEYGVTNYDNGVAFWFELGRN